MTNKKLLGLVAVLLTVGVVIGWFSPALPKVKALPEGIVGAAGNLLAENYIPYVMYNGGFNTAKDVTISGATSMSGALSLTSTFTLGSSGTSHTRLNSGQCYFNPTAATIVASTTVDIDCQATAAVGVPNSLSAAALTGVTSGDNVVAVLSTSTAAFNGTTVTSGGGLVLVGASASTTSGYIRLRLYNAMGTTYTYPVQTTGGVNASGTASYIVTK